MDNGEKTGLRSDPGSSWRYSKGFFKQGAKRAILKGALCVECLPMFKAQDGPIDQMRNALDSGLSISSRKPEKFIVDA